VTEAVAISCPSCFESGFGEGDDQADGIDRVVEKESFLFLESNRECFQLIDLCKNVPRVCSSCIIPMQGMA